MVTSNIDDAITNTTHVNTFIPKPMYPKIRNTLPDG